MVPNGRFVRRKCWAEAFGILLVEINMSLALNRESFFWHKVHSLTGIIPVGFYMVQHLTLNSFSLGGADKFNGVIGFFEAMPKHILIVLEVFVIWLPLVFHAIYGIFIVGRAQQNFIGSKYGWSQNRMYWLQRASGVYLLFFLAIHVSMTTIRKYVTNNPEVIMFNEWHMKLTSFGGLWLIFYVLGITTASYHLAYGIWNFCIRWGITVSDAAQVRVQKLSLALFVGITLLGYGALAGFLLNAPNAEGAKETLSTSLR